MLLFFLVFRCSFFRINSLDKIVIIFLVVVLSCLWVYFFRIKLLDKLVIIDDISYLVLGLSCLKV